MQVDSTTFVGLCQCGCGSPLYARYSDYIPQYKKGHHFRRPLAERFWEKVNKNSDNGCWLWTGSTNRDGVGHIGVEGHAKEASRVSWELQNGPIPDGTSVCRNHLFCSNLLCINPGHLILKKRGRDPEEKQRLCACGCGQPLQEPKYKPKISRRFILGHARRVPVEVRFWQKVNKTDTCWLWTAMLSPDGYGNIKDRERSTPSIRAHRFSWELHFGPIPNRMLVCHKCDIPACVRPDHLFLGTDKSNSDDKVRKGRQQGTKGEIHPSAKLTEMQVKEIRAREHTMSAPRLGAEYGVSSTVIYGIWKRHIWKNID